MSNLSATVFFHVAPKFVGSWEQPDAKAYLAVAHGFDLKAEDVATYLTEFDGYEAAATLDDIPVEEPMGACEYCFSKIQNIDTSWTDTVTPLTERTRSVSTGDVVVLSNGEVYVCAPLGFMHLPREVADLFLAKAITTPMGAA